MQKRNYTFDILKVIALLCIILAHVNPNKIIFQLRNFDVPLMIMISVWLSMNGINNKNFKYINYIVNRSKRLIIPTYIFLTIYFVVYLIIGKFQSIKTIITSYLLIGGIGYVWVIRIYIYIAIMVPIINKIHDKVKKELYIAIVICTYALYNLLIIVGNNFNGLIKNVYTAIILDFMGYSFIVAIGILVFNLKKKEIIKLDCILGLIFILLAIKYNFIGTQNFKYPLRLYYLSYALFVGILLYLVFNRLEKTKEIKGNNIIIFISKNSMWIYLWHIMYIDIVNMLFLNIRLGYIYRFVILISCAILTTYIQNKVIKFIFNR